MGETIRGTSWAYNTSGALNGLPSSITNALSEATQFTGYDSANRVSGVTLPNFGLVSCGYDANGNLKTLTAPSTNVTTGAVTALARSTHTLGYSLINQLATHAAPAVTGETDHTVWGYTFDRQIAHTFLADGVGDGTTGPTYAHKNGTSPP